jgi:ABC-type antimicrobial peptide transport system permease subunit
MSETAFPVNDLLRRRLQTGLTVISLTTCVASTLFLLLFSGQIGFGIAARAQDTLTLGTSKVLGQFLTFVGALIFIVGAIIVSFIVFLMMAQRTKDFGLMKATGCPNSLVFGYFLTELLGVTFIGCVLGIVVGLATDYLVINMPLFQVYNHALNFWFVPLVFAAYFAFALVFGAKPLFDAARITPIRALSSTQYFGLAKGTPLKPLSRTGLTIRIATRSLFRRKSATVRIAIFLSAVFLLLTVCIAGGIIANDTSTSWVEKAIGRNVLMVANGEMATQYVQLLESFAGDTSNANFSYLNPAYAVPNTLVQTMQQIEGVAVVDTRLVWQTTIKELGGYTIDPDTLTTFPLGDSRQRTSLIVGLDGANLVSEPFTSGFFLNASGGAAVVGDSIAYTVYSSFTEGFGGQAHTVQGDPLRESVMIQNTTFRISGLCVDPLNRGYVTYVPLSSLENITGVSSPNVVLLKVDASADYQTVKNQVQNAVSGLDPNLSVIDLNNSLAKDDGFLGSLWGVIMFLPAFALAAATLCLISFQRLTIDEQHQEFAILRATGAKPATITAILAVQSITVLFSTFAVGTSLGTILCVIILISHPVISGLTALAIAGWLLAALLGMFLVSLYPAVKFAKKPLLEILS